MSTESAGDSQRYCSDYAANEFPSRDFASAPVSVVTDLSVVCLRYTFTRNGPTVLSGLSGFSYYLQPVGYIVL
jgi:hypothetical protein